MIRINVFLHELICGRFFSFVNVDGLPQEGCVTTVHWTHLPLPP